MDPHTTTAATKPKPKTTDPATKAPTKAPPAHTTVPAGGSKASDVPGATETISPSAAPSPAHKSTSSGGLSTPAIAGIAAAGGLIILFIISVLICKRRRAQRYARRDHNKHDPSRDPINPNDVLPPLPAERKFESIPLDESFNAYPLAARFGGDNDNGNRSREGPLRPSPSQQALHQDYPDYEEHIQSRFESSDRNAHPGQIETQGGSGNGGVGSVTSPTLSNTSMEKSRIHGGAVAPMSPSQRAQRHSGNTPRSPRSPRSQPDTVVNDMGNQFVIQSSNSNPGSHRPSVDQDGSVVGSDQGYRSRPTPRNQDPNGGRRGPGNNEGPGYGHGPGPYAGSPPVGPLRGGPGSPPVGPLRGGPGSSGSPVSQHSQQQPYPQQPYPQQPYPQQQQPYPQQQQPYQQQQPRPFTPQNQPPQQPFMYPPQQQQQQQQGNSGNPRRDNGPGNQPRTQY
ncbi:hypothetical protein EMPS_05646 [Entomortierella parvispora]|uniref:Uncharacterized protein n=1 Tax=Entomortierella parvispora TaxID=205924 RepID=A0A9P3HB78_9FUNG|nr:hypothetical protein EMPS_05646 [Entomortierella parvispora]